MLLAGTSLLPLLLLPLLCFMLCKLACHHLTASANKRAQQVCNQLGQCLLVTSILPCSKYNLAYQPISSWYAAPGPPTCGTNMFFCATGSCQASGPRLGIN
jgi:hypothetical protein